MLPASTKEEYVAAVAGVYAQVCRDGMRGLEWRRIAAELTRLREGVGGQAGCFLSPVYRLP